MFGIGGCYGNGPGLLDYSGYLLTLNSGYMNINETYNFRFFIRKGNRTAYYDSSVLVVGGDPPEMSIRFACHKNYSLLVIYFRVNRLKESNELIRYVSKFQMPRRVRGILTIEKPGLSNVETMEFFGRQTMKDTHFSSLA